MKVLHLANVIGEHKGGGVHEVVSNYYAHQIIHGVDAHVWYPGDEIDSNQLKKGGNNVRALSYIGPPKYGLFTELFQPIPNELGKFDIIHQHGIWMPISIYSNRIKSKNNIPFIIQPHGYLEPYSRNLSKYKKMIALWFYERQNIKTSSVILACSEKEAENLKTIFTDASIAIIPNGVSDDLLSLPSNKVGRKRKKRMLFLSQIIPVKGLERFLKVLSRIDSKLFSGWEIIIAGYDDGTYTNRLKELSYQLGLREFVQFVGPQLGKAKLEIIDNSDVFILPSFSENFGIVVAEALARGIPVITTKGAPWSDLERFNCGLWVENNELGLENGIRRVLEMNISQMITMGNNGKALIKSKYLWDNKAQQTIELYSWLLGNSDKPTFVL